MKTENQNSTVQSTGRGVIYIAFAKFWFMITGWALVFLLPRIFKSTSGGDSDEGQALYGAFGIVFMGVSFINNGIITGTIQSVSKFTSHDLKSADAVRLTAMKVMGVSGLVLALLYALFSGIIARWLGSPGLAPYMCLSSGIIVFYALYAVFIGGINGKRQYNRQAGFDIVYATMKVALILGLAFAGLKVLGTVIGFLTAAIIIAIAAFFITRSDSTSLHAESDKSASSPGTTEFLKFAFVLIAYTFLLNLVMSLDLFLLKAASYKIYLHDGLSADMATKTGEIAAGKYKAVQGLAFIPYQAILSIAFVVFPMVSKAVFDKDTKKTKAYIHTTMRFSTIFVVGLASVLAALPKQAMGLVFPVEYLNAAPALKVLSMGIASFGLMVIVNTILNSAGMLKKAMTVIVAALFFTVCSVLLFVFYSDSSQILVATALGSTVGMTLGLIAAVWVLKRNLGAVGPYKTFIRVLIAFFITITVGYFLPDAGKLFTLVECIIVLCLYIFILVILREFNKQDLENLKRIRK